MPAETAPRSRGRPRNSVIDQAILEAAVGLLAERGFEATTVEAVAARCGIGRATVYRRYRDKYDLIEAGVEHLLAARAPSPRLTGDPLGDVLAMLENTVELLTQTPFGRVFRAVIPHLPAHPRLASLANDVGARRRAALKAVVKRAVDAGRLRRFEDVDTVIDGVIGAIYFRFLITDRPVDRQYLERLVGSL